MNSKNILHQKHIFDIYSCKEEYNPSILDKMSRFRHSTSNNFSHLSPLVSEYLHTNSLTNTCLPPDKKFTVFISHDIDFLFDNRSSWKSLKRLTKSFININIEDAGYHINNLWNKHWIPDKYSIDKLLKAENDLNVKSTFFFLSVEKYHQDFNYNLKDIRNLLQDLIESKHEIGLHSSRTAFNNIEILVQEKERLEDTIGLDVLGNRNHFLYFDLPNSWSLLREAGIKYDVSFCYPDACGFRNGMCHPFYPYNCTTGEFIDISALPLHVMDATLFNYMGLTTSSAFKLMQSIISKIKNCNGMFNLLWHNSNTSDEHLNLYRDVISYCKDEGAWFVQGKDLLGMTIKKENLLKMQGK